MIYSLVMFFVAAVFIIAALKFMPSDEATRLERAKAAGEAGLA